MTIFFSYPIPYSDASYIFHDFSYSLFQGSGFLNAKSEIHAGFYMYMYNRDQENLNVCMNVNERAYVQYIFYFRLNIFKTIVSISEAIDFLSVPATWFYVNICGRKIL